MSSDVIAFECKCNDGKTHRLTFDGGQSGPYKVDLCHNCYKIEDKQFMVSESEVLPSPRESET